MPTRSTAAFVAALALTMSACDGDPQSPETVTVTADDAPTPTESPTPIPSATSTDTSPTATPVPDESTTASPSPTTAATGGPGTYPNGEAPLELTQSTGGGLSIDLTRIVVEGNSVLLDVTALNATNDRILIARDRRTFGNEPIEVRIDDGPQLLFREPTDNPQLEVESGSELTGTLAFIGRIPGEATTVDVVLSTVDEAGFTTGDLTFSDIPLP